MIEIGILSTYNSPLLSMLILDLNKIQNLKFHILIDEKGLKEKDFLIWKERTDGKLDEHLKPIELNNRENYKFKKFTSHNDLSCIDYIKTNNLSWVVNCGTPRKISPDFLKNFNNKVVNIHPGLLPKYRGSCCVEWALYNGDEVGNTLHLITEEYDEGPIIMSEGYNLNNIKNYSDIRIIVYKKGISLLFKFFKLIENNTLPHINLTFVKSDFIYKPIPTKKLNQIKKNISLFGYKRVM